LIDTLVLFEIRDLDPLQACIDPSDPVVLDSCRFSLYTSSDNHQHLPSLPDLYPLLEQESFLAADDKGTTEERDMQANTNIFKMDVNDMSTGVKKSSQKRMGT
jgi:hypothetical protein